MKYKVPKIELPEGVGAKLVKAGVFAGLLLLAKHALGKAAKNNADDQLDTDPAAGQARTLDAAMNRSGFTWLRKVDGTNEDVIYQVAAQITDLDKVKDYYKAMHENKRNLSDDLESEIGAEGYQKFLALATKGKTGNTKYKTVLSPIPANMWVITKADANVRKTPKLESKFKLGNNIVKLVPSGKALGVTTGKYAYVEKDDVTFIEFYTFGAKVAGKHYFYVAKSQVEFITDAEKKKREKTAKIPLELLAGISGTDEVPQTQLVSIRPTTVYDEHFKPLIKVNANIIIGFPVMSFDTGASKYIKVTTVQGNIRWVNENDVITRSRF